MVIILKYGDVENTYSHLFALEVREVLPLVLASNAPFGSWFRCMIWYFGSAHSDAQHRS